MSADVVSAERKGGTLKKCLFVLLKVVLTVLFLKWAFSKADFSDSKLAHPSELDWTWISGGLAFAFGSVIFTAVRWWLLLRAQSIPVTLWRTIELTFIGNLFNLVAFGGVGGDAARIFLLIRDFPDRKLAVTLTVMVDHLVGLVSLALIFFCVSAGRFDSLGEQSRIGREVIRGSAMFFGGGLVMIALMFVASYPPVHRRIHHPGRKFKWAFLKNLPELYDVFRRKWGLALGSLAASFVMLGFLFASYWAGARSTGIHIDAAAVFSAMPVVDAAGAIPSLMGVGPKEKTFQLLMSDLTGMPPEVAVCASLVGFFCTFVWSLAGALLFLKPRDRVRIKDMESAAS
ncbi:MAG: hypothetical protein JWO82_2568 [Akkermansiaceae bacterium]|nr:hypothetical protein [Akkermansiaceae bacterium]